MACGCDNWAPTIRSLREHFDERHCLACGAVQVRKRISYIDILLPTGSSVPIGDWEDATYDHRVYRAELRVPIGVGDELLPRYKGSGGASRQLSGGAASAPEQYKAGHMITTPNEIFHEIQPEGHSLSLARRHLATDAVKFNDELVTSMCQELNV